MIAQDQAAQFEDMLAQLKTGFLAELPELCDQIENEVLALEAKPDDQGAFETLYRNVHSLKGSGGTFGLTIITRICHQFENFLSERPHSDSAYISHALVCVDLLRQAGEQATLDNPDFRSIEETLDYLHTTSLKKREPVLLAESSGMMRALYQQALDGLPLQLTFVDSGLNALQMLLHTPYRVLIIGRELGDLNGLAVLAALRASDGHNRQIPAILVSSRQEPLSSDLGIDQLLGRDMKLVERLPAAVKQLLDRQA